MPLEKTPKMGFPSFPRFLREGGRAQQLMYRGARMDYRNGRYFVGWKAEVCAAGLVSFMMLAGACSVGPIRNSNYEHKNLR